MRVLLQCQEVAEMKANEKIGLREECPEQRTDPSRSDGEVVKAKKGVGT